MNHTIVFTIMDLLWAALPPLLWEFYPTITSEHTLSNEQIAEFLYSVQDFLFPEGTDLTVYTEIRNMGVSLHGIATRAHYTLSQCVPRSNPSSYHAAPLYRGDGRAVFMSMMRFFCSQVDPHFTLENIPNRMKPLDATELEWEQPQTIAEIYRAPVQQQTLLFLKNAIFACFPVSVARKMQIMSQLPLSPHQPVQEILRQILMYLILLYFPSSAQKNTGVGPCDQRYFTSKAFDNKTRRFAPHPIQFLLVNLNAWCTDTHMGGLASRMRRPVESSRTFSFGSYAHATRALVEAFINKVLIASLSRANSQVTLSEEYINSPVFVLSCVEDDRVRRLALLSLAGIPLPERPTPGPSQPLLDALQGAVDTAKLASLRRAFNCVHNNISNGDILAHMNAKTPRHKRAEHYARVRDLYALVHFDSVSDVRRHLPVHEHGTRLPWPLAVDEYTSFLEYFLIRGRPVTVPEKVVENIQGASSVEKFLATIACCLGTDSEVGLAQLVQLLLGLKSESYNVQSLNACRFLYKRAELICLQQYTYKLFLSEFCACIQLNNGETREALQTAFGVNAAQPLPPDAVTAKLAYFIHRDLTAYSHNMSPPYTFPTRAFLGKRVMAAAFALVLDDPDYSNILTRMTSKRALPSEMGAFIIQFVSWVLRAGTATESMLWLSKYGKVPNFVKDYTGRSQTGVTKQCFASLVTVVLLAAGVPIPSACAMFSITSHAISLSTDRGKTFEIIEKKLDPTQRSIVNLSDTDAQKEQLANSHVFLRIAHEHEAPAHGAPGHGGPGPGGPGPGGPGHGGPGHGGPGHGGPGPGGPGPGGPGPGGPGPGGPGPGGPGHGGPGHGGPPPGTGRKRLTYKQAPNRNALGGPGAPGASAPVLDALGPGAPALGARGPSVPAVDAPGPNAPALDASGPSAPALDASGPSAPGFDALGPSALSRRLSLRRKQTPKRERNEVVDAGENAKRTRLDSKNGLDTDNTEMVANTKETDPHKGKYPVIHEVAKQTPSPSPMSTFRNLPHFLKHTLFHVTGRGRAPPVSATADERPRARSRSPRGAARH